MAFGNATKGYVKKHSGGGGGGGTTNYSELSNKPQINGVTLSGNKTSTDLNITEGTVTVTTDSSTGETRVIDSDTSADFKITPSTTDLTAGTSSLSTGNIYLVYE